jgi:hypothetical protein
LERHPRLGAELKPILAAERQKRQDGMARFDPVTPIGNGGLQPDHDNTILGGKR